jgi:predicted nucleic-acid-binding Zn-ribbon protein
MICPKCGSTNVITQAVTNVRTKHRGCLGWMLWILLAIVTVGLILIIPLITNTKVKSKTRTEAVCQNCGYRWRV